MVLAKAPFPGRSKTRLCPPCTPAEAALLAEAALEDTLHAVAAARAPRRLLVLEGETGPWLPDGFDVVPQRPGDLSERLAGAFEAADGPALLVGMDTPQLTPALLEHAVRTFARRDVDAALGSAPDGGYWAIGLRRPDAEVFRGIPMSTPATGAAQRRRLGERRLRHVELPALRDVDTMLDAYAVAKQAPRSRFARSIAAIREAAAPRRAPGRFAGARRPPMSAPVDCLGPP